MRLRLAAALALLSSPALAGTLTFRATNQNLEQARKLVAKGRFDAALEELATAEALPGNTNAQLADLYVLRATALLGEGNPDVTGAKDALVRGAHMDPEDAALARSGSEAARRLSHEVLAERLVVLHQRLVHVEAGLPVRVRARATGPVLDFELVLHYRPEGISDFAQLAMDPVPGGQFEAWLRPHLGGVSGDPEQLVAYYIDARAPDGTVLDTDGDAAHPILMLLTGDKAAAAAELPHDEGGGKAPAPPPPPLWKTPWALATAGSVAVAAVGVGLYFALRPGPAPKGTLGEIDISK